MSPRVLPQPGLTLGEVAVLAAVWAVAAVGGVVLGTRLASRWWG